jgi:hypothetical protein
LTVEFSNQIEKLRHFPRNVAGSPLIGATESLYYATKESVDANTLWTAADGSAFEVWKIRFGCRNDPRASGVADTVKALTIAGDQMLTLRDESLAGTQSQTQASAANQGDSRGFLKPPTSIYDRRSCER